MSTKPVVAILGTFHMRPTTDIQQLEIDDLSSDRRQREIEQCVAQMLRFKPTKVAVEVDQRYDEELNQSYEQFLRGQLQLKIDEVHQLGFRIAKAMGHRRIYPVDWMESIGNRSIGDVYEWAKENQPDLFEVVFGASASSDSNSSSDPNPVSDPGEEPESATDRDSAPTSDPEPYVFTILDQLIECNRPENALEDHRRYINLARIGRDRDYVGIDWLRWWYQRNLAIYVNLARLMESASDRILLIIGAAHVHLVSQFLQESGLCTLESTYDYLIDGR